MGKLDERKRPKDNQIGNPLKTQRRSLSQLSIKTKNYQKYTQMSLKTIKRLSKHSLKVMIDTPKILKKILQRSRNPIKIKMNATKIILRVNLCQLKLVGLFMNEL